MYSICIMSDYLPGIFKPGNGRGFKSFAGHDLQIDAFTPCKETNYSPITSLYRICLQNADGVLF